MAWSSTGHDVTTSKQVSCSVLFHSGSITVKQFETSVTVEKRGLTEDAAKGLVSTSTAADTSTPTQYWRVVDGRTVSITAITGGTKTEKSAARRDESGQWVVSTTSHTYSVAGLTVGNNGWSATELDADGNPVSLSAAGDSPVTVSVEKSVSRIAWDVFQTLTTTVTEIRHVNTAANAASIVNSNTSSNVSTSSVSNYYQTTDAYGGTVYRPGAWCSYQNGTEKFAVARRVGLAEGFTVSITEKVYGWSSPRASAIGEGWR